MGCHHRRLGGDLLPAMDFRGWGVLLCPRGWTIVKGGYVTVTVTFHAPDVDFTVLGHVGGGAALEAYPMLLEEGLSLFERLCPEPTALLQRARALVNWTSPVWVQRASFAGRWGHRIPYLGFVDGDCGLAFEPVRHRFIGTSGRWMRSRCRECEAGVGSHLCLSVHKVHKEGEWWEGDTMRFLVHGALGHPLLLQVMRELVRYLLDASGCI